VSPGKLYQVSTTPKVGPSFRKTWVSRGVGNTWGNKNCSRSLPTSGHGADVWAAPDREV